MELFKNTNFDFLGRKWPFIIASLILTAAGLASLAMKGGPRYGIDFKGGTNIYVRFNQEPPTDRIRAAVSAKIPGEISVQQITGKPEVLIGTEIRDEKQLNAERQVLVDTLTETFGEKSGKLDVNNAGAEAIANRLREPLQRANVAMPEEDLQKLAKDIAGYRASHGGLYRTIDELSAAGVKPEVINVAKQEMYAGPFTILQTDVVGPKVGGELRSQAILATLYALAGMLVYIAFRFEWIYGVAAVIAVFHDTVITIGLFSLFDKPIDLTVVAALLTLVGYSMNDTIVVFDRIRENLKTSRREGFAKIVNNSINQTLSRTVLTSGLTFLSALALWLFGGQVLNGFSFALVVGILVGTYSSIFIASPILIFWQDLVESRKKLPAAPARTDGPGAKREKVAR
ncbi:MAG: protein translocase subunit SecF [Bryobacteraceae bacterium]|nr:protein translocase subunit SecF [Bryobacteraceae bacterium]